MVASIEETAERYEIPKTFIGLILIPFVVSTSSLFPESATHYHVKTNAAANVTSMRMARKDHMELAIGICMGSSIVRVSFFCFLLLTPDNFAQQIATFVIPLLVMIGWM